MLADRAPTTHQTVWLSLKDSMDDTEPWEAHLVATSADTSGKHLVRMRFTFWVPLDAILELHEERRLWQRYPAREKRDIVLGRAGRPAYDSRRIVEH